MFTKNPATVRRQYDELRRAFTDHGTNGYWRKQMDQASDQEIQEIGDQPRYWPAQSCAHLGDYDRALRYLTQYFEQDRHAAIPVLFYDECWDPVHEDPRFVALLKLTGLRQ